WPAVRTANHVGVGRRPVARHRARRSPPGGSVPAGDAEGLRAHGRAARSRVGPGNAYGDVGATRPSRGASHLAGNGRTGPLMVAQYLFWARRLGTERTTWQYLQAEPHGGDEPHHFSHPL